MVNLKLCSLEFKKKQFRGVWCIRWKILSLHFGCFFDFFSSSCGAPVSLTRPLPRSRNSVLGWDRRISFLCIVSTCLTRFAFLSELKLYRLNLNRAALCFLWRYILSCLAVYTSPYTLCIYILKPTPALSHPSCRWNPCATKQEGFCLICIWLHDVLLQIKEQNRCANVMVFFSFGSQPWSCLCLIVVWTYCNPPRFGRLQCPFCQFGHRLWIIWVFNVECTF